MSGIHAGLRTCVGCRQRRPVQEMVQLHAVRGAGRHQDPNRGSRDAIPATVPGQGSVLVVGVAGRPVAPQCRDGVATTDGDASSGKPRGKGAHTCPTMHCARRALQILLRQPSGRKSKASGQKAGAEKGGDSFAVELLEQVAQHADRLAAARQDGLKRRGADLAQDARLGVLEALRGRLAEERRRGA